MKTRDSSSNQFTEYRNSFLKMGQTRPLFGLFSFFFTTQDKYSTNFTINDKSIDGVLGSQTWGGMMEGADVSTELWRHPYSIGIVILQKLA